MSEKRTLTQQVKDKHSPTPWTTHKDHPRRIFSEGKMVAEFDSTYWGCFVQSDNVAFVLRAVNSYDSHRELIRELVRILRDWDNAIPRMDPFSSYSPESLRGRALNIIKKAEEAMQ